MQEKIEFLKRHKEFTLINLVKYHKTSQDLKEEFKLLSFTQWKPFLEKPEKLWKSRIEDVFPTYYMSPTINESIGLGRRTLSAIYSPFKIDDLNSFLAGHKRNDTLDEMKFKYSEGHSRSGGDWWTNQTFLTGWDAISMNENVKYWTTDVLLKYQDKWNYINLANNKSLPWSVELIEKLFLPRHDNDDYVSHFGYPNCSIESREKGDREKTKIELFSHIQANAFNEFHPWTFEILLTFEKYFVFNRPSDNRYSGIYRNSNIWFNVFSNIMDDKTILELLEHFKRK